MEKRTHLGDGLVLELTGSLGELRELGSLGGGKSSHCVRNKS